MNKIPEIKEYAKYWN